MRAARTSREAQSRLVSGAGPLDAVLYHLGEAPGKNETRYGIPFIGMTGQYTRSVYRTAGLEVARETSVDIRFNNVVPFNPGRVDGHTRDGLVWEHWDNITRDLEQTKARVIVACGGLALRRLTGLTNITDEHGGVIPARDLPEHVTIRGRTGRLGLPRDALVIPCLHPAGVFETALQAERVQVEAVLRRAATYAKGKPWAPVRPEIVVRPLIGDVDRALEKSNVIVVDTEFDEKTREPFAVGVLGSGNPGVVYVLHYELEPYLNVLRKHLVERDAVWKVSHYNPAEYESFARLGLNVREKGFWYDTLLAYATLYPDTAVGLNHAALFYMDDMSNWKGLDTTDPTYLALDVWAQWRVFQESLNDLRRNGMWDLFTDEVMPTAPLLWDMEQWGIQVDTSRQERELERIAGKLEPLAKACQEFAGPYWQARAKFKKRSTTEMRELMARHPVDFVPCGVKKHETYDGLRAKKWTSNPACTCKQVYEAVTTQLGRESHLPFNPGNNHDLRWLLYEGLELPVQLQRRTGKKTADATAVRRLLLQVQEASELDRRTSKYWRDDAAAVVSFLVQEKEYQHLLKMRSTFLLPPVDEHAVAHPPYRPWGAGTGRPAGGAEKDIADDMPDTYSFNALNIPEECRVIFVPHKGGS